MNPGATRLSILFVNHESWAELEGALTSLREHPPGIGWSVVVVDNDSGCSDPDVAQRVGELLEELGGELVLHGENRGYGGGINLAMDRSRGDLVLACNPDILFGPGCIDLLVDKLLGDEGIGVVTPAVYLDEELAIRAPAHILPTPRDLVGAALASTSRWWNRRYSRKRTAAALLEWERTEAFDEEMFGGCCFLARRELLDALGRFDEEFPLYFEDTDLARRVRTAGKRIVQVPAAKIVHLYGRSTERSPERAGRWYAESRARYFAKWHGRLGTQVLGLVQRCMGSGPARARRARLMAPSAQELDPGATEVRLPRRCDRFVVEVCDDPLFLLAGGAAGSGDRWVLPRRVRETRRTVWTRVLDVSGGEPRQIAAYCVRPRGRGDPGGNGAVQFNRILGSFREELSREPYREKRALVDGFVQRMHALGLPLRSDSHRDWEYAHVLLEVERMAAREEVSRILDIGGGNAPLAYCLAAQGFQVVTVDVDPGAVAAVQHNAAQLGEGNLRALESSGVSFDVGEDAFDAAVCVSVFEGILRRDRPAFWREVRRVLEPGASILLTFDYGEDARFVGDPPTSIAEVADQIVRASGLELVGEPPSEPRYGEHGPPVKAVVPTVDGYDYRAIAYTFGAVRLRKPLKGRGRTPDASPG